MIIAITGRIGSGKTLFLVKQLYQHALRGDRVVCNIPGLKFSYEHLTSIDDLPVSGGERVVLGLDESYAWIDSRGDEESPAKILSWYEQRNSDIYISVPDLDDVYDTIRTQISLVLETSARKSTEGGHLITAKNAFPGRGYYDLL